MTDLSDRNVSTGEAREKLAEILNRAAYGKERVVIRRRRKAVAAVVPIEDLELLEEIEDRLDAADLANAKKTWSRSGRKTIPLDAVLADMGMTRRSRRRGLRG